VWPIQLPFLLLEYVGYFSSTWLFVHFSFPHNQSTYLLYLSSAPHFKTSHVFYLLSEVSKFQPHTKLHSKFSTLLLSSLNLSPICWWKESFSCWMLLLEIITHRQKSHYWLNSEWTKWLFIYLFILAIRRSVIWSDTQGSHQRNTNMRRAVNQSTFIYFATLFGHWKYFWRPEIIMVKSE